MTQNLGNLFIDGESVIEDETGTHTIINNGVTINTLDKKFGTSSITFGSSSYLSVPDHTDFDFTGDFTVDFWAKNISGGDGCVVQLADAPWGGAFGYVSGANLSFYLGSGSSWDAAAAKVIGVLPGASWVHYAVVRSANTYRTFMDGIKTSEFTDSTGVVTPSGPVNIGRHRGSSGALYYLTNGNVDNLRIVKGEALWTSDFSIVEEDLFYEEPKPMHASTIYNTKQMKLRGKASEGFIRPTIAQFFTSMDFHEMAPPVIATGGTITEINDNGTDYRVHTFLEDGVFTPTGDMSVEYLVVGGGGAGGSHTAGAGGAGRLLKDITTVEETSYPIVVGDGGLIGVVMYTQGGNGETSSFAGYSAYGGGGGGAGNGSAVSDGKDGGSGGGAAPTVGTIGVTSQVTGWGNDGGQYFGTGGSTYAGGGGGGAGSVGQNGTTGTGGLSKGGNGGTGMIVWGNAYAGGGGGGVHGVGEFGLGSFGGGNGALVGGATAGLNNTGGGGGGGGNTNFGANGGSGIVIIRYEIQ